MMTVIELMTILRSADPLAKVAFLPWGADEDEAEEVDAVCVPAIAWTRETYSWMGRKYKTLHQDEPRTDLPPEYENVAIETVSIVILSVDADFLKSRRFL